MSKPVYDFLRIEVQKKKNAQGIEVIDKVDEYYTYNQGGFEKTYVAGVGSQTLKISPDAIVYTTSGMMDAKKEILKFKQDANDYADSVLSRLQLLVTKMQKNVIKMEKNILEGRKLIEQKQLTSMKGDSNEA